MSESIKDLKRKYNNLKEKYNVVENELNQYKTLEDERKLIKCNIPLRQIVYVVTNQKVFDHESGKEPPCNSQLDCRDDCEFKGKECKDTPVIEQKIFIPNSVWFEFMNKEYGKCVFDTLEEAKHYAETTYANEAIVKEYITIKGETQKIK